MNTNTKSIKSEVEEATAAYTTLFNKGLERAVEVSKSTLDLAVEQNAEILGSYKKALKGTPGVFLFDLAGQAFAGFVSLQKNLLDIAVEQSAAVIDAATEISQDLSKAKAGIPKLIEQSVDRTVAAQNSVLDFAAKQNKAVSDAVKQQPGVNGTPAEKVTDSAHRSIDSLLATQKELLDITSKNVKSATAKA